MPLRSMTGYGRAKSKSSAGNISVEIRGLNNRFLDIQLRIPSKLHPFEDKIRKMISANISRGSVVCSVSWNQDTLSSSIALNDKAVTGYLKILNEIKKKYNIGGEVKIDHLLDFSDVFVYKSENYSENRIWKELRPVLSEALQLFHNHRNAEGSFIQNALNKNNKNILKLINRIEKRAPLRLKRYSAELRKKIGLLSNGKIDSGRLAAEISMTADKLDISEECTRVKAHINKLNSDLESEKPAGKRINFMLQEINREANTIASKANDIKISHWAVELKEEIESVREQIQNIE